MVAIDNAAARDRKLWPIKSKDTNTAGMSKSNRSQADTGAASPDSSTAAIDETSVPGDVCICVAETQHAALCRPHPLMMPYPLSTPYIFLPLFQAPLLSPRPRPCPLSQGNVTLSCWA